MDTATINLEFPVPSHAPAITDQVSAFLAQRDVVEGNRDRSNGSPTILRGRRRGRATLAWSAG
jgi:hypothetical protein